MCVYPFKNLQARTNVGKVTQCLSHDPWREAFFLLGPWAAMGHERKGPAYSPHLNMNVCVSVPGIHTREWAQHVHTHPGRYWSTSLLLLSHNEPQDENNLKNSGDSGSRAGAATCQTSDGSLECGFSNMRLIQVQSTSFSNGLNLNCDFN